MAKFQSTGSVENSFKKPHNPVKHNEVVIKCVLGYFGT